MFVWGTKAQQYVLYRLGLTLGWLSAKKEEIVPLSRLKAELARQKQEHRVRKRTRPSRLVEKPELEDAKTPTNPGSSDALEASRKSSSGSSINGDRWSLSPKLQNPPSSQLPAFLKLRPPAS